MNRHCLFMTEPHPRNPSGLSLPLAKSNVIIIDIETSESRFGFAGDESTQARNASLALP